MMTKEDILSEIRRVARERGGRVGRDAFQKTTGIHQSQFVGKYWATWGEALSEAGIAPVNFKRPRVPEKEVLEALAQLIARLRKWPTVAEMLLERHRNSSFPHWETIDRRRKEGDFQAKLLDHCANRPDLAVVGEIVAQQPRSEPGGSSSMGRAVVQGYVYMMRSGRNHKIGHTNSPTRRHREVSLNQPKPTTWVHSIETDDPNGIEAYWHRRFESKRIPGTEFFTLDATDVAAFKRRKSQ